MGAEGQGRSCKGEGPGNRWPLRAERRLCGHSCCPSPLCSSLSPQEEGGLGHGLGIQVPSRSVPSGSRRCQMLSGAGP